MILIVSVDAKLYRKQPQTGLYRQLFKLHTVLQIVDLQTSADIRICKSLY